MVNPIFYPLPDGGRAAGAGIHPPLAAGGIVVPNLAGSEERPGRLRTGFMHPLQRPGARRATCFPSPRAWPHLHPHDLGIRAGRPYAMDGYRRNSNATRTWRERTRVQPRGLATEPLGTRLQRLRRPQTGVMTPDEAETGDSAHHPDDSTCWRARTNDLCGGPRLQRATGAFDIHLEKISAVKLRHQPGTNKPPLSVPNGPD